MPRTLIEPHIIHDAATYPGLVLRCKPIGVLCVLQTSKGKSKRNDRVFALPDRAPFEGDLQDIRHLPARAVKELEKFFEATDALEEKNITFLGWKGPSDAINTIKKHSSRRRRRTMCDGTMERCLTARIPLGSS
jgi:inorganic pyrophosphatase